jgi:alpha-beta hydrolase superfamily lysophospholipase
MAHRQAAELSDVAISGADGTRLWAWSLRPQSGNDSVVILLHGLSDNRIGMLGYAEMLLSHGFSVLMADARAHGASGGELATYGLLEADDIHRWSDWLHGNQHSSCIFGFGESMGAAQSLESLQTEPGFCAVAAESPFSSFREIAYDRVGQFFHTGPWLGRLALRPVVEVAFCYARWKYKYDFERVSPDAAVAASQVPVLLIHGREDRNISVRHSRRIANRQSGQSVWPRGSSSGS